MIKTLLSKIPKQGEKIFSIQMVEIKIVSLMNDFASLEMILYVYSRFINVRQCHIISKMPRLSLDSFCRP